MSKEEEAVLDNSDPLAAAKGISVGVVIGLFIWAAGLSFGRFVYQSCFK